VFGTYVQEICDRLGVSWEQVARKAGIDPSTVHYWCTGEEPNPKPETLLKFYLALKDTPEWIDTYKQHLFILAGQSTEELREESRRFTEYLKHTNKVQVSRQEIGKASSTFVKREKAPQQTSDL